MIRIITTSTYKALREKIQFAHDEGYWDGRTSMKKELDYELKALARQKELLEECRRAFEESKAQYVLDYLKKIKGIS